MSGGSPTTPTSTDDDERDTPTTAAILRNTISAKEYEVHRLEVEIGRHGMDSSGPNSGGGGSSSSRSRERSRDLLKQLQDQLEVVSNLKKDYRNLTGKEWHHSNSTGVDISGGGSTTSLTNPISPMKRSPAARDGISSSGGALGKDGSSSSSLSNRKRLDSRDDDTINFDDSISGGGSGGGRSSSTGVPRHWLTSSSRDDEVPDKWELAGRLFFLLLFCALIFSSLSLRRLLGFEN